MDDRQRTFWLVVGAEGIDEMATRTASYAAAKELAVTYVKKYGGAFAICESIELVAPKGTFTGKIMPVCEV